MRMSFIGLGKMGQPIAANLLKAKFDLTVWNRTPARADSLVATGAKRAASLEDASLADVVWIIRKFQPDVIIARFPTTGEGGHGQHTASAILAGGLLFQLSIALRSVRTSARMSRISR